MKTFSKQDEIRWKYNINDVIYTREIFKVQQETLARQNPKLQEFHDWQQRELVPALTRVMERGIRIDVEKKNELQRQLTWILGESKDENYQDFSPDSVKAKLNFLLGENFNPKSTPQMRAVFQDLLGIALIRDKKSGNPSCASNYMFQYLEQYPEYRPIISLILEYRSIGVFLRTFVSAKVDEDGRMRTSYNPAGTKTYRLSSRKNAFGYGANLANIPSKGKIKLKYALQELENEGTENTDETEEVIGHDDTEGLTALPNCKEFFIPDEGFTFWNADYSGADAMVVAWDSDCAWLKNFFKTSDKKLYTYVAEHFLQKEFIVDAEGKPADEEGLRWYKIFKQWCHGCVTADHEVLTPDGWKTIDTFNWETEKLAVWNPKDKSIWFERPKDFTSDWVDSIEDLYEIEGTSFSFLGTQDHKFPYLLSSGRVDSQKAVNLNRTARIPYSGRLIDGNFNKPKEYIQLIAALQADGHIQKIDKEGVGTFFFHFHKRRKIARLKTILTALNIPFQQSEDQTRIWFKGYLEPYMKQPDWWMLTFTQEAIAVFVNEILEWDGSVQERYNHKSQEICTVDKLTSEVYQTLIHLTGKASKVTWIDRDESRQRLYKVSINNRNFYRVENGKRSKVKHEGTQVYCPTTSTGFFLIRRKGNIYVTGNSHYGMKEEKAALNAGIDAKLSKKLHEWYFGLNPEILNWHKRIASDIKSKHYVENIFGARGWFMNKDSHTIQNQAIAWLPQSTIAVLTNKGLVNIDKNEKNIHVLMQVHDALAGQFLSTDLTAPERIKKHMTIELPYPEPLTIPVDISTSTISYGHCK